MRYCFYFMLLVTFSSVAQTKTVENDSLLIWNKNRKLTWGDFLSKEKTQVHQYENNAEEYAGAVLVTSISIFPKEFNCQQVDDIVVVAIVNKKKSCAILKNDEVLNHEQTHFDITELYARKIRKEIAEYKALNKGCDLEAIAEIYYRLEEEHWQTQFLYDKEVRIEGQEEINQKKWDRKIDSLLNVYKEYARDIFIEDLELD